MTDRYHIYQFLVDEIQEAQDWLNRKSESGFKLTDTYYYVNREGQAMNQAEYLWINCTKHRF